MLTKLREKIRALIEDFSLTDFEVFEYTTSNIFTIATSNITITEVLVEGSALASGESYSYSSTTGKITVTRSWTSGDILEVNFTFSKYSTAELNEYIRAALSWISIFGSDENDYELETTAIYPTPDNVTLDKIALIASILIKPDFIKKKLPNSEVIYPRTMTKEQQIRELILMTNIGIGIMGLIQYD
ncbi:hypothetical protein LCGC14_1283800 [marine sediment metagenome]|uniref:Uncharacterized protein n=1 Tax=marine sediment metagenome TaxID=412755 RepID=A0A0F9LFH8_9ZZZZ